MRLLELLFPPRLPKFTLDELERMIERQWTEELALLWARWRALLLTRER